MNMMRKLLKSDGGLGHVDLEESICEQPCATGMMNRINTITILNVYL